MRPLDYNSAHLTKDLAQAQGGQCWRSPVKSWVSWQPGRVGRSDLCNTICGYSLGQGLVAKGAGAPEEVCSRSLGLTVSLVSWFPGEVLVRHLCSGHYSAPSGVHSHQAGLSKRTYHKDAHRRQHRGNGAVPQRPRPQECRATRMLGHEHQYSQASSCYSATESILHSAHS